LKANSNLTISTHPSDHDDFMFYLTLLNAPLSLTMYSSQCLPSLSVTITKSSGTVRVRSL